MIIEGGGTFWARQTEDSEVFCDKPHVWFKIWFFLINRVNHADTKRFDRGSCFMRYEWITEKTKANRNEIDHCFRWLKKSQMLATAKATRGMTVTVLNYDHYQTLDNYKGDSKSDLKAKQKRNKSDTINKNGKNGKNEKKEHTPLPPWLDIQVWNDFKDHRKQLKPKMTPRAEILSINKLDRLRASGNDPTEVINQSIEMGWKGLFELKGDNNGGRQNDDSGDVKKFLAGMEAAVKDR